MFGNKALHEVKHPDLIAFLMESRDEGVRLDYKEQWTDKIVVNACAFANTYGGYILYGVKEITQKNRPNQPDPHDVPGVVFSKGDPTASLRSKILDNTRPPVPLEIKPVPLPESNDRGVLIAYVEESVDAPHEVLINGATRIPVRRVDTTAPASLDEIEQLIGRRESMRRADASSLDLQFFGDRFDGPRNVYGAQFVDPEVAVVVRPPAAGGIGEPADPLDLAAGDPVEGRITPAIQGGFGPVLQGRHVDPLRRRPDQGFRVRGDRNTRIFEQFPTLEVDPVGTILIFGLNPFMPRPDLPAADTGRRCSHI